MKLTYNEQFENESTGFVISKKILLTRWFVSFIVILSFLFIFTTNQRYILQNKNVNMTSNDKYSYTYIIPSTIPSLQLSSQEDDYDSTNTKDLKHRRTRHPTRSYTPIQRPITVGPTYSELITLQPTPSIVTDDFHITPIIIINTDKT